MPFRRLNLWMPFQRIKLWAAGLIALLMGFPFTPRASAQVWGIVDASLDLAASIADSAGNS